MALDIASRLKARQDQGIFLSSDDVFYDFGLFGIRVAAAYCGVEDLNEVQDVFVDLGFGGSSEVKKIEQFDVEGDALSSDHDVVVVDVAVIFASGVDGGDASGEGV